ncbi:MAG: Gfo/Idh/MocA family oxidoreductase [Phycisphaerales bacterium]
MSSTSPIGVGVIGLGFMGATHIRAYAAAHAAGFNCPLVGVCDQAQDRLTGRVVTSGNIATGTSEQLFDPAVVRATPNLDELLADPRVQLVSICTHTESHVDTAIRALEAGKHVLVEKPIAVAPSDVERLAHAARAAAGRGLVVMPAMCIRFWPGWSWVKDRMVDGTLGRVKSAVFQRLGTPPAWSPQFYRDNERTGGALVDLHIHDADFVYHLFGRPDAVTSAGTLDHVTTLYHFGGANAPAHVVAEGAWDHTPGFSFRMRFIVVFERGTADFDLGRTPQLLLCRDGKQETIPLEAGAGYDFQVREVVSAIRKKRAARATIDEALEVSRVLDAERRSLRENARVALR